MSAQFPTFEPKTTEEAAAVELGFMLHSELERIKLRQAQLKKLSPDATPNENDPNQANTAKTKPG